MQLPGTDRRHEAVLGRSQRCRSFGLQDDDGPVQCLHCGYDRHTGALPEDLGTLAEASAYARDTAVYLEDPGEEPSPTEAPTSPEDVEVAHPGEEPSPTEAPTEAPTDAQTDPYMDDPKLRIAEAPTESATEATTRDAQTDPYMDIPQRLERCRRIAVESAAKVARTDGHQQQ